MSRSHLTALTAALLLTPVVSLRAADVFSRQGQPAITPRPRTASPRPQAVYYAESPVTLQVTVQRTGPVVETGPDANGLVIRKTSVETTRLGNADVLATMQQRGLIPRVTGHALVAVWASWPDADPFAGSSFRFFVRKVGARSAALTRVPADILGLTPQDWLQENNLRLTAGIPAGTARFESYSKLQFGIANTYATLLGADEGGGRFRAPTRRDTPPQYLPSPGALRMNGPIFGGVCTARVDFGSARFVPRTDFKPGSLPQQTMIGFEFGSFYSYANIGFGRVSWDTWIDHEIRSIPLPPYVHYFCPIMIDMTLDRQVTITPSVPGREITQIETTGLTTTELVSGALQARGISDPAGWTLYLHAKSDVYSSISGFDLVLGHSDGRILQIGSPNLTPSFASAKTTHNEYLNGVYVAGIEQELTHLTHDQSWSLADGHKLRLIATGPGEIESTYGPVPEALDNRMVQPVSATFQLFGTYDENNSSGVGIESGLARVSITVASPIAQADIPAGWASVFVPYSQAVIQTPFILVW